MKHNILIGHDSYCGYYLIINPSGEHPQITADDMIIDYFNLPENYWFDNLAKFNSVLSEDDEIYFIKEEDCKKAKQWVEDNLDYFLILKKLGE
jgi:hypothetical protein